MQTAVLNNEIIPVPAGGINSDTCSYIYCSDEKHAAFLFEKASRRLLDVNTWGNFTSKLCAGFALTDSKGNLVEDEAKEGYRIRINIPGPGSKTGKGYDWASIEKIELSGNRSIDEEYVAMKVRPSSNPKRILGRTAHFFKSHATSTFRVKRSGLQISCSVKGKNEKPNINQKTFLGSLRNFLVAILSIFGFSKLQWKCLTKGILSYSNKEKEMVR